MAAHESGVLVPQWNIEGDAWASPLFRGRNESRSLSESFPNRRAQFWMQYRGRMFEFAVLADGGRLAVALDLRAFYSERGDGKTTAQLRWAELTVDPFKLGSFSETTISRPEPSGANTRTVSEIAFDADNRIYIAGTYDPGDNGPFNSVVWRVGQASADGRPRKVKRRRSA